MRIGLFDFLNAYPYQRALQEEGLDYTLFPHPRLGVAAWQAGEWDAFLLPLASLCVVRRALLPWGIGAKGPVGSVLLLGTHPPATWRYLQVDARSTSSVALVRWAMWKGLLPRWEIGTEARPYPSGQLWIGEEALRQRPHYAYSIDVAELLEKATERTVVFAVWWVRTPRVAARLSRVWRKMAPTLEWRQAAAQRYGFSVEEVEWYWGQLQYRLPRASLRYWQRVCRQVS